MQRHNPTVKLGEQGFSNANPLCLSLMEFLSAEGHGPTPQVHLFRRAWKHVARQNQETLPSPFLIRSKSIDFSEVQSYAACYHGMRKLHRAGGRETHGVQLERGHYLYRLE